MHKETSDLSRIRDIRRYVFLIAIILTGIALSSIAFIAARNWDLQKIRKEFEQNSEERYEALRREIEINLNVLDSVRAFYNRDKISRSGFREFVQHFLLGYPGIQALEWVPRIPDSRRKAYEKLARRDGFPVFQFTDQKAKGEMVRASQRQEYFPVYYVEPIEGNEIALGFDLGSSQTRMEALRRSRDTGEMTSTARITLVQEVGDEYGFLVLQPIYRKGAPADSIGSRRKNLEGFALGVFRIGSILERSATYLSPKDIDIFMYDNSAPAGDRLLGHHPSGPNSAMSHEDVNPATPFKFAKTFDLGGREWQVLCTPAANYVGTRRSWQPWEVLFTGLLFTAFSGSYLLININRAERIERLVKERTGELQKANEALSNEIVIRKRAEEAQKASEERFREMADLLPQAVYETNVQGFLTYANRYALALFGYTQEDFENGINVIQTLVPQERDRALSAIQAILTEKSSYASREYQALKKDGRSFPIEAYSSPIINKGVAVGLRGVLVDLTDRKRAEDALKQNEEALRVFLDAIPYPAFLMDRDGIALVTNSALVRSLAKNDDSLTGKNLFHCLPPGIAEQRKAYTEQIVETGKPAIFEDSHAGRTFINYMYPVCDHTGAVRRIAVFAFDITERKRAEEALRSSEERFRAFIDNSPTIAWAKDEQGCYVYLNRTYEERFGVRLEDWRGKTDFEHWNPDVAEGFRKVDQVVLATGQMTEVEVHTRNADGSYCTWWNFKFPFQDALGRRYVGGVGMDITERKRAEEALRESEEKYRLFIENAQESIVLVQDETLKFINQKTGKITGYSCEELISKSFTEFVHPDDQAMVMENLQKKLRGEPVPPVTAFRIVAKDGTIRWAETNTVVISWNGKPATLNFLRDVTERKRAEESLRASEEKFAKAFHHSPIPMTINNFNSGKYVDANAAFLTMSGWSREDVIGHSALELGIWASADERSTFWERLREHGFIHNVKSYFRSKSGKVLHFILSADKITLNNEPCLLVAAVDITEQDRAEEERALFQSQLSQAQKMEAIGTLAGGIAHDFNNILSAILGYGELASLDLGEGSKARHSLDYSMKAAHRAKDLVQQILTFSRQGKQERKLINIRPIVKEALKFLRASLPVTIEIHEEIEENLGPIEADPTQIYQVLVNLCTNAAHAMGEKGGELSVSLSNLDLDGSNGAVQPKMEPGPYVRLRVGDTGHGMAPEILERIFDPYFTTKGPGKGTGLGLAVVHGIVKSYGGEITVSSEVGKGSTFDVYFQRIETEDMHVETRKVESLPLDGREQVLFVDDEDAIVDIGREILEHLGYAVTTRTSSIEALELFRAKSDRFDLVITDMTMPNMTGDRLAQELLKIRPNIPILLCTGFSEYMTEERAKAIGIRELLMKPIAMKELAKVMRRVLDPQRNIKNSDGDKPFLL